LFSFVESENRQGGEGKGERIVKHCKQCQSHTGMAPWGLSIALASSLASLQQCQRLVVELAH
jgi:hypothetical protein